MRKYFLFIFILFSSTLHSQDIFDLETFRLLDRNFQNINMGTTVLRDAPQVEVVPKTVKYPSSNFLTRILKSFTGDTVWFSTGTGVMRTIDGFRNYQHYFGLEPFGEDGISGIGVTFNVVAVATSTTTEVSGDFVPTGTGIKVSTDGGTNWSSFPQPMDGMYDTTVQYGSNILSALPVVVPQQNLSFDIAITRTKNDLNNFTIWITSFAGGLRKSTDYGNSWHRVVLPPDNIDSIIPGGTYDFILDPRINLNHRAFTIEAQNDSVLYVGTANGINKSTDWGESWRKYNFGNTDPTGSGNGISGNFVTNIYVQSLFGQPVIWAASRKAEGQLEYDAFSFTTDNGITWKSTLGNIKPNNVFARDTIIYALTDQGVWKSTFGQFLWVKPGSIIDNKTNDVLRTERFFSGNYIQDTLYIGTIDGMCRTRELGTSWTYSWKIIRAIDPIELSSDIKTYAAPNPFAPDDEVTRIFYKTNKPSAKVTIKLFDFGMNQVRTIIQNATRFGTDELFTQWDGKNDNGLQVANGVYFYRIKIDGDDEYWGKILVIQ